MDGGDSKETPFFKGLFKVRGREHIADTKEGEWSGCAGNIFNGIVEDRNGSRDVYMAKEKNHTDYDGENVRIKNCL